MRRAAVGQGLGRHARLTQAAGTRRSRGRSCGRGSPPATILRSSGQGRYFESPSPSCSTSMMLEAGVEPDQVGERERAHRVVHAELHHRVDRLPRRHALHQRSSTASLIIGIRMRFETKPG